ncbi:ABC transporter ATP-binding protein [Candidatus Woesearchaeota archaeon]|nr:ABC transporter ATP-binding protein [Candidatus Woesearchaeota archaeon]
MGEALLELKQVSKRYGKNVVLDDVSLKVPDNAIVGVIGKSGCGKTTLLNILVGFLNPTEGKVFYKGSELRKILKAAEYNFGFSSQDTSFYKKLNVKENMVYFGRLYGLDKSTIRERTKELLKLFNLEEAKFTLGEELSSGMQKRLDIACALIHKPEILILDEPTADLDPIMRKEILMQIKKVQEQGTTVIITSHILSEVEYLCDPVFILHENHLIPVGAKEGEQRIVSVELASHKYDPLLKLLKAKKLTLEGTQQRGNALKIITPQPEHVLHIVGEYAKKKKDHIITIHLGKGSLARIFEKIVKKEDFAEEHVGSV